MSQQKKAKTTLLNLEVQELESKSRAGCNSSSTNPRCTCPVGLTVTGGDFRFSS